MLNWTMINCFSGLNVISHMRRKMNGQLKQNEHTSVQIVNEGVEQCELQFNECKTFSPGDMNVQLPNP